MVSNPTCLGNRLGLIDNKISSSSSISQLQPLYGSTRCAWLNIDQVYFIFDYSQKLDQRWPIAYKWPGGHKQ